MMMDLAFMPCNVCESRDLREMFRIDGFRFARCRDCGHLYVTDNVTEEALQVAYDNKYYVAGEGGIGDSKGYSNYLDNADVREAQFRERLQLLTNFAQMPGRLLDYGCAVGLFVKVAKEAGWNARGYERSPWAAEYGRARFGVDITVADGEVDPFERNAFDVVTLWDVLEHLKDPSGVLGLVNHWLTPGGFLALNTVNSSSLGARIAGASWRHLVPPQHLQFFSKESLLRLLANAGFRAVWVRAEGVLFGAGKRRKTARWPMDGLETLVRHWRIRPLVTSLNLLDEVAIIAVKA
jgi:2-polyprenyl-3-methyl-5-hydroxy-6-metoxy-1,4-benzoquinol methylase